MVEAADIWEIQSWDEDHVAESILETKDSELDTTRQHTYHTQDC